MTNELESMALKAMDKFMATFNSRNPKEWSLSLQYPHVRPSVRRDPVITMSAEEYADGFDFQRPVSMGWDHSEWDSREIVHLSDRKAHGAGQYSRYNAQGEKFWTNQVVYIITKVNDNWGIKARLGLDFSRESSRDTDEIEPVVTTLIKEFIDAANDRNNDRQADLINFPYLEIDPGLVNTCETKEDFGKRERPPQPETALEWHQIRLDRVEVIQISNIAANLSVEVSYLDSVEKSLASSQGIYMLTLKEGHWGVHAVSVMRPL